MNTELSKQDRLVAANSFIKAISGCGRKFFQHQGFVSSLELSKNGRVYFIDYYTKKRIYTHKDSRWDGFSSGGTLKCLIQSLRDFICKGDLLNASYFDYDEPRKTFSNPWGYGADILKVKDAALSLGIAK